MNDGWKELFVLLAVLAVIGWLFCYRPRWRGGNRKACGTARWAMMEDVSRAGMLACGDLVLGRTSRGKLLWSKDSVHTLVCGSTGSGKGVSLVIPNLLSYWKGSVVTLDVNNGELFRITAEPRRQRGQRIVRLAPWDGGTDALNPMQFISRDENMIDECRAYAEALVVRTGMEPDQHWPNKSVSTITMAQVFVLLQFRPDDQHLGSVREITCSSQRLREAAAIMVEMGGIPARLGHEVLGLYSADGELTKEGASVISSVGQHLSWTDSEPVSRAISTSTFDPVDLGKPGTTVYVQIPPHLLSAQKGLLRYWLLALIRGVSNAKHKSAPAGFFLDEASCLNGFEPLREGLVRGRSSGIRLVLVYQGISQVEAAFKDERGLILENCSTQIFLPGGTLDIETAERLSRMLGPRTIAVNTWNCNDGRGWSRSGSPHGDNVSGNQSWGESWSVKERPLLNAAEILRLDPNLLICFHKDVPPILLRRIKYYQDSAFAPKH